MKHSDYIALSKIISELQVADQLMGSASKEAFQENEMQKRAITMTVINVGELVKVVSEDTRTAYPDIAWKQAAGFRDVAAHKYQTLNMGDVYDTVKEDFPKFRRQLQEILNKETDEQL